VRSLVQSGVEDAPELTHRSRLLLIEKDVSDATLWRVHDPGVVKEIEYLVKRVTRSALVIKFRRHPLFVSEVREVQT
jgi:hypothetical protein